MLYSTTDLINGAENDVEPLVDVSPYKVRGSHSGGGGSGGESSHSDWFVEEE